MDYQATLMDGRKFRQEITMLIYESFFAHKSLMQSGNSSLVSMTKWKLADNFLATPSRLLNN